MLEITNDQPNSMHAEWVLSNVCNYKCSYCDPRLNEGTHRWPSLENFGILPGEILKTLFTTHN